MTKLFDEAIAEVRKLPEAQQDLAAEVLFSVVGHDENYHLTPDQVREVERIQRELREGTMSLASDEDVAALWKKCGL